MIGTEYFIHFYFINNLHAHQQKVNVALSVTIENQKFNFIQYVFILFFLNDY